MGKKSPTSSIIELLNRTSGNEGKMLLLSPLSKLIPSTTIKPEVLSIIAGIHTDKKSLGSYGEIIIKTPDEYWITGKTSNEREFYVIIQEKNANLKDISDEVKRICETQMKGIFFYPV